MMTSLKSWVYFSALIMWLMGLVSTATAQQTADSQHPVALLSGGALIYIDQDQKPQSSTDYVAYLRGDRLAVQLDTRGQITPDSTSGRLLVSLIRPGQPRVDVRPDRNGRVEFVGVSEGVAAIVVSGDSWSSKMPSVSLYAALPVFLVVPQEGTPISDFVVPLAAVRTAVIVEQLRTVQPLGGDSSDLGRVEDYELVAGSRFRAVRGKDNSVIGKLLVPRRDVGAVLPPVQISIYQDGQLVRSTQTDESGRFVLSNLSRGVYGLVANGPLGHGAFSIEVVGASEGELVEPTTAQATKQSLAKFVSTATEHQTADGGSLQVGLIPYPLADQVRSLVEQRAGGLVVPPPGAGAIGGAGAGIPGGGFAGGGGGFAGGGGGFAGGGGAGFALGAAGLAAGIAAAASDDDVFFSPPVSTPNGP